MQSMPFTSDARSILHLDADAFFASIEQRDDPRLRGKPVAVGTGVVASCSYEARRWGVSTGMRLAEARRLCRRLVVIPGEYRRYEQAARRMLAVCQERTPLVEVAALDDLYLDLTQLSGLGRVTSDLRGQIRDEVGLSVSIGMGINKLVAKVATKEAKRSKLQIADCRLQIGGGQTAICNLQSEMVHVPAGSEQAYLAPWPAR